MPCVVPLARPSEVAISPTPSRPEPRASSRRMAAARSMDCTGPGMAEMVSGRPVFDYVESWWRAQARANPASRVNMRSACFRHAAKRYFNLRLLARERPEFGIVERRTLTVDFALLSYALVGLERPVRR